MEISTQVDINSLFTWTMLLCIQACSYLHAALKMSRKALRFKLIGEELSPH